jgi:hypothetical protein
MHFSATPKTVKWLAAYGRHSRTIETGFLVCSLVLFCYALLDWIGWLPFERGLQPLRMLLLSAALALQSVAVVIQRRSMILFCCLLAVSVALLGTTFAVTS